MNNIDKQYQSLLQDILDNGVKKSDRTGTGTISVFGRQIRHKMSEGFPLLTTKKMYFKGVVTELLWFLRGDTNISYLLDNDCHIWDGDAYKFYLKNFVPPECPLGVDVQPDYYSPMSKEDFIKYMKLSKTDGKRGERYIKEHGELGPIYGAQWRRWKSKAWVPTSYLNEKNEPTINGSESLHGGMARKILVNYPEIDQIANLIKDIKENPDSRRLMVSAWNVAEIDQMALPPCHYGFQIYTRELSLEERMNLFNDSGKNGGMLMWAGNGTQEGALDHNGIPTRAISLMWNQRSIDTFLGLPFNIASYALLLEIIAKEVNMVPDELIGNLGDTHLYLNHIEQAKEQIGREMTIDERSEICDSMGIDRSKFEEIGTTLWEYVEFLDKNNIPKRTRIPYELPKLKIDPYNGKTLYYKTTPSVMNPTFWESGDFIIENYQSHPAIKADLSN
jgi:thymidylate synthase